MTEVWIVDDCGTLINMQTRDTFDYVSDVCNLLNEKEKRIKQLKKENNDFDDAGTLINMETMENYDYMEEVVGVLNKQSERISVLEKQNKELIQIIKGISKDSADAISKLWRKGMYD